MLNICNVNIQCNIRLGTTYTLTEWCGVTEIVEKMYVCNRNDFLMI